MRKESKFSLNIVLPLIVSLVVLIIAVVFSDRSFASPSNKKTYQSNSGAVQLADVSAAGQVAGSSTTDEDEVPLYSFEMQNQKAIKESYPLVSYLRTTVGIGSANIIGMPSMGIAGMSGDEIGVCATSALNDALVNLAGGEIGEAAYTIIEGSVFTKEVLASASEAAKNIGCNNIGTSNGLFGRKGAGSLMGITKIAFDSAMGDPMPVKLAYYTNDLAQRLPIIKNTTYAQDRPSYENFYGGLITLSIWKVARNIAYAMMAIFMLVIGAMIIMRKEVGRAYVNVQTSIPRVIISLILITFSYPIGAVLASMIPYLIIMVTLLFASEMLSGVISGVTSIGDILANPAAVLQKLADFKILLLYPLVVIMTLGNAGIFAIFFGLILLLLTVLAVLAGAVKMMIIYLKIMLNIVFAPIQFAVAALPGKDDIISGWFKRMAAYVVSIPAIALFIVLAWFILTRPLTDADSFRDLIMTPSSAGFVGDVLRIGNALFSLLMLPFMAIMTLFFSLRVDKKIEEFFVGAPKKR